MTTKPHVSGKGLSSERRRFHRAFAAAFALLGALAGPALASDSATDQFLGARSCASSMCHGGAGDKNNQFATWTTKDFHTRAPATLSMARSARLAETLKIEDATTEARCTVCHNPMATLPAERKSAAIERLEAVSCETCHNAAARWLRTHTRTDISYADKVSAGMRDLRNLYVRANTCVACHQNLEPSLRAAGHPELIFELDGQCADMPRHWLETNRVRRAQAWLVGQMVALREAQAVASLTPENQARAAALAWIVAKAQGAKGSPAPAQPDLSAREMAAAEWSSTDALALLKRLASTHEDFPGRVTADELAMRAERVVMGLDRATVAVGLQQHAPLEKALDELFADIQSRPDFAKGRFTEHLRAFAGQLEQALTAESGASK